MNGFNHLALLKLSLHAPNLALRGLSGYLRNPVRTGAPCQLRGLQVVAWAPVPLATTWAHGLLAYARMLFTVVATCLMSVMSLALCSLISFDLTIF